MADEKKVQLMCRDCGLVYSEEDFSLTCKKCNAPSRVVFDATYLKNALAAGFPQADETSFLQDWFDFLPIKNRKEIERVSLGEKEAIMLPSLRLGKNLGVDNLHLKLEMGPTLSLKDRGTALSVLKALEFGCKSVCLASSGNNAASLAAYGARANLSTVIFVQKDVSPAKIAKSRVYGAKVIMVDGDMAAASKLCSQMVADHGWFQCGGPNPYRIAAKRLVAYGIVRKLGKAPDTILLPCGGGAGIIAAYDGFQELYEAGIIDKMPRIVLVQLEACNPIAVAFANNEETVTPITKKKSISDAIMNNNPYWGKYCLQAVRNTGGTVISVSDAEFLDGIRNLAKQEGLFVEPAGAVTVAALPKLQQVPGFEDLGLTVCTLTGHGLNFPHSVSDDYDALVPIAADPELVMKKLQG